MVACPSLTPPEVLEAFVLTVKVPAMPFCFLSLELNPELVFILPLIDIPFGPTKVISPPRPGVIPEL